ncbi:uncharacterized protein LOC116615614 [Nematostella vectensis]|uniref:uncharacterized protein LOC116615614 n=1 Tax=Nematostella vectensis TaxID=45351 RepID=UPI0020771EFA|nr:uncharacterized protein LOC116615614 [Nematostella vectensis]
MGSIKVYLLNFFVAFFVNGIQSASLSNSSSARQQYVGLELSLQNHTVSNSTTIASLQPTFAFTYKNENQNQTPTKQPGHQQQQKEEYANISRIVHQKAFKITLRQYSVFLKPFLDLAKAMNGSILNSMLPFSPYPTQARNASMGRRGYTTPCIQSITFKCNPLWIPGCVPEHICKSNKGCAPGWVCKAIRANTSILVYRGRLPNNELVFQRLTLRLVHDCVCSQ